MDIKDSGNSGIHPKEINLVEKNNFGCDFFGKST